MTSRDAVIDAVLIELQKARNKHAPMNSAHEGYAVLLEEVDELWEEVRKQREACRRDRMRDECIQIAAMAIRFIEDVCGRES